MSREAKVVERWLSREAYRNRAKRIETKNQETKPVWSLGFDTSLRSYSTTNASGDSTNTIIST